MRAVFADAGRFPTGPEGRWRHSSAYDLAAASASSRRRSQLGLLALGVVVVICANAAGQIGLNRWQGAFYEAIEQRQVAAFMTQLMVFALIAGALLVLVVSQTWLQAMINVRLREWLMYDLLDQWLVRKRVYLLGFAGEIGVNPDQRIQQDAQHLTELRHDPGDRPASVLAAAHELHGRALGPFQPGRFRSR